MLLIPVPILQPGEIVDATVVQILKKMRYAGVSTLLNICGEIPNQEPTVKLPTVVQTVKRMPITMVVSDAYLNICANTPSGRNRRCNGLSRRPKGCRIMDGVSDAIDICVPRQQEKQWDVNGCSRYQKRWG